MLNEGCRYGIAAFAIAAAMALAAKNQRFGMRSPRLNSALIIAPKTNPICTLLVIQDC